MTTDLTVHGSTTSLAEQMEFARTVVSRPEGGATSILPESYRGNPANVLIAVGLGASMGLSPAESLYRISVIKGKPSAGAELIASNVRKAGHRLRVRGDETTCTATITRADDPDYEFTVTRDLAWARQMGLASGDNYKKQPGTMLQWRAITAVARLACPEALYGVTYSPDEIEEARPVEATTRPASGADRLRAKLAPEAPAPEADPAEDIQDAEVIEPAAPTITPTQSKHLHTLVTTLGLTRDQKLAGIANVIGHPVESTKDLTADEATWVIDALKAKVAALDVEGGAA